MPRPIWKGNISFGLVNIPVALYSAEKPATKTLHFHLLDSSNHARIRYEKVNEQTGKVVPWEKIEKAYEFEKGNYVIVDEKVLEKTAAETSETVEIEEFVDKKSLDPIHFNKPYYLFPGKAGEKGYILLRDTLERSEKIGIAKVVIRTRQYLTALLPYKKLLILMVLRYDNEIRDTEEFKIPESKLKTYKVSQKEVEMAEKLIESMSSQWNPKKYHDKNRELLTNWIQKKVKRKSSVFAKGKTASNKEKMPKGQVIDFMELLKKSIQEKKKKPKGKTSHPPRPSPARSGPKKRKS